MTGHLTDQELEGFRNHTSAPQQLLRADRHLASCAECQRRLRSVGTGAPLPSLALEEEPVHATYEQICAYLDNTQDASHREWMEYHLQACAQCAAEVKDLKQFDARMEVEAHPVPAAATPETGWRERLTKGFAAFFAAPQRPGFVTVALSFLVVGLVAITQVEAPHPTGAQNYTVLYEVTHFAPADARLFYGGILLAALGLAGVWYRFRK